MTLPQLTSLEMPLDMSAAAFGYLRPANELLDDPPAMWARMAEEGYLYLREYLDKDQVRGSGSRLPSVWPPSASSIRSILLWRLSPAAA